MKKRFDYHVPSLGGSWALTLMLLLGGVVFGIILGFIGNLSPSYVWKAQSLSYVLMMLFPFAFIYVQSGYDSLNPLKQAVAVNAPDFGGIGTLPFFLLMIPAMLSLSILIEPATSFIPMSDRIRDLFEKIFFNTPLWDSLLSTCLLAPLCEEMLCRGMIARGIAYNRTPWKAILWSAFIFALIHLNPWQSIPAFIIGLFFGWIYLRTRCLWVTIFLHFINNGSTMLMARLFPDMEVDSGLADMLPRGTYLAVYFAALAVFAAIVWFLHKRLPSLKEFPRKPDEATEEAAGDAVEQDKDI